jgi:PAS domain S-box-containing protein
LLILIAVDYSLYQMHLIRDDNWLAVFIIGLGSILIIIGIYRALTTENNVFSPIRMLAGGVILCYGVASLLDLRNWWPLVVAIAGLALVLAFVFLRQEANKRKIVQETLLESELKYRHIIDNANSIIMDIDPGGNITFINKFGREFFGYKEEEMLGHNLVGTIVPSTASSGKEQEMMINDIALHPEKYLHTEMENLLHGGDKAWIIWTYKPVFDEKENLKEILCIGIDRTEQRKTEELATQQLKEKSAVEERTRLARDLHDAVSQTLFSASLIADVLPRVWERNKEEGQKRLEEVRQLTRGSLAEMRTLLFELRPAALADAELADLLRQLGEAVNGRARLPVAVEIEGACQIPVDVKITLYRIAQEALNNVTKHSGATHCQIRLSCLPREVNLHIIDDGHGFNSSEIAAGGFGLGNIRERANQIGAILNIDSKINEGTDISVVWRNHAGEMKQ